MLRFNFQNQVLTNPTLAIKTGGSALAKSSNAFIYTIKGDLYYKAASDMSAISGTIADGYQKVYAFCIDAAGTITTVAGSSVANTSVISSKDLPVVTDGTALIGLVWIKNASGSTFTGNSTALDASNVTTVYTNQLAFGL